MASKSGKNDPEANQEGRDVGATEAIRRRRLTIRIAGGLVAAVAILAVVFALSNSGSSSSSGTAEAGQYKFAVGTPGPGEPAPLLNLPSTQGGNFDLASQQGKTTLLYFQEGLTCQPCWDQITDLEPQMKQLNELGIDQVVSITSDPLDQIQQKVADEGISIPVLSDSDLAVSAAYGANNYGMMGTSRDGHSFVLVGPDGQIQFRADYGGAPDYTMYVPVPNLLADLQAGLSENG